MMFRIFLLCFWCALLAACSVNADGSSRAWTLQESYWLAGMLFGIVATTINMILFWRGRPDKMKASLESAVKPLYERIQSIEESSEMARHERQEQRDRLIRIEAETESAPTAKDIAEIHKRISEAAAQTAAVSATQKTHTEMLNRISSWLMNGDQRRGGK
jgi:hypothetical protein